MPSNDGPPEWTRTSRIANDAVVDRIEMAFEAAALMSQPWIVYGSPGTPVPEVTPFVAVKFASPSMRIGPCAVSVEPGVVAAGAPTVTRVENETSKRVSPEIGRASGRERV